MGQQGHMMRTLLFVCAIALLCQPGSAGPLKETIKKVAKDTWTTLAGCDEQCKDTCCRDGGGAACVSACGCSGSCPNKDFEALISSWESVASSVGSGCAKPGACGTAYQGCCFGAKHSGDACTCKLVDGDGEVGTSCSGTDKAGACGVAYTACCAAYKLKKEPCTCDVEKPSA